MKAYLVACFLVCANVLFSQNERRLISQIDSISSSALSLYDDNQYVKAFNAFNEVKKISDSINHPYSKSLSNFYLGNIYRLMDQYDDAKTSYAAVLKPASEIKDSFLLANAYLSLSKLGESGINKGIIYSYLEKAFSLVSVSDFNTDNKYTQEQKDKLLLSIGKELCEYHIKNNNLNSALVILDYLEGTSIKNYYFSSSYNYLLGLYQSKKGSYDNAEIKLNEALALLESEDYIENSETELLFVNVFKALSFVYSQVGDKDKAYQTLLKYNKLNESYLTKERIEHAVIDKSKFFIEDYRNNLEIANSEKVHQLEVSNNIRSINFVITMALLLLAILLVTLYRSYYSKRKLARALEKRNEELEFAKNEALKSCELKSKFISNVTHELRTPLYGVVGITSLLLENNSLKASDRKYLKSLKYSGDYLLGLINEVLEFSKIESEKIELKKVSVELRPLIENIIGSFEYKIKETNNKIHLNFDQSIPKYIKCDNVRLSQVLINLMGNSIKFTSNGDIFVNVMVKHINALNNNVDLRFEVQDNGSGIPKEKFKMIFENFSQLDDSNTSYKGTGLGLSITKKIVELFGSKIELESEFGLGSTFSFNVNFEIDKEGFEKAKVKTIEKTVRTLNSYRILIAEDNKINQVVTKRLLEKGNYDCEIVENGIDAIEKVKNKVFDLVLMDINMPKMGGIEATNFIREFNTSIPVIALTAADIEDFNVNEEYDGFNGLITKPFDNYEFFQTIETNIELSKNDALKQKIS